MPFRSITRVPFIGAAQTASYGIFRYLGRYDRAIAGYCAMPGGLIEAVTLGERASADVQTLSVQHFMRVILVIALIPLLFLLFTGYSVGSGAGRRHRHWTDWALIVTLAAAGSGLGSRLRVPAQYLIGPMILTAALQATGTIELHPPQVLLNLSQLIVGAGLGSMFARATARRLLLALGLGLVSVGITLAIASVFALLLSGWVPMSFPALLISFASGGVAEMSLVALSLGISPVL